MLSATKCDSWSNFVREVESIEHAKKTISAPTPIDIDSFQGHIHKCGKYGHAAECRKSSHGGAEKPQCAQCGENIMDSICWTRSFTSSQDGKKIEKEMAREHRRVASLKEEKVEPKGNTR